MAKDPRHEILTALKSLRLDIREVSEGYLFCKEAEVETLCEYLLKMPVAHIKEFTSPWLRKTRNLKLKPAKGRLKDLKKIDRLLGELLDNVIEFDDLDVKPKSTRNKGKVRVKTAGDPALGNNSTFAELKIM